MVWRKPLMSTYSDNYRYGSSLYGSGVSDVERQYRETLSRTHLRSDRGDLGMYTFAGSSLHGGPVFTERSSSMPPPSVSRSATNDLYAPMSFGYGRNYYNNLRADSQQQQPKPKAPKHYYDLLGEDQTSTSADLKTHSAKTTSMYDDAKKTITTTTTTERWVPLSSYLCPTSYYHYSSSPIVQTSSKTTDNVVSSSMDDYYKSTTTKVSRNVDALDLNVSSQSMDKFDHNLWMEKCHNIQSQLDHVLRWLSDAETKIKSDVAGARNKMQTELTEVAILVEDTNKYNEELQRVIKRQARQISDLHSQQDEISRYVVEVNDNLEKTRSKCQSLQGELTSVQTGLEMAMRRK